VYKRQAVAALIADTIAAAFLILTDFLAMVAAASIALNLACLAYLSKGEVRELFQRIAI